MICTPGRLLAQVPAGAHERARGAQAGHEVGDLRQVGQQLGPGGLVVGQRVVLVAVLVEHHPGRVGGGQLLGHPHRLVGAAGGRREDDLRAVGLQQLAPLSGGVLRHHADQPVAAQPGHHGQRDAGVARGRLEDRGARRQQAVLLRRRDHVEGGAVLDRAGRVAVLQLGPQPHVRPGRQPGQADQRRAAERVEQVVVAHVDLAGPAARGRQPAPPATAGSTVTVSPSCTSAARPPRNRTSSSFRYTLTKRRRPASSTSRSRRPS